MRPTNAAGQEHGHPDMLTPDKFRPGDFVFVNVPRDKPGGWGKVTRVTRPGIKRGRPWLVITERGADYFQHGKATGVYHGGMPPPLDYLQGPGESDGPWW